MLTKNILVTGGAGYIGSQMVLKLLEYNFNPIVYDTFPNGLHRVAGDNEIREGNLCDYIRLREVFEMDEIHAVIHLAGSISVEESTRKPEDYYDNNVSNTLNLLQTMREYGVNKLIFSSSASVYGNSLYLPMDENHPKNPTNPYAKSKLIVENILEDYKEIESISLRYFNVCGADLKGRTGENHNPETHLIPNLINAALNKQPYFTLYGDGSNIRDYIHVEDVTHAHLVALKRLLFEDKSHEAVYNIGTNKGYSVLDIINEFKTLYQFLIPTKHEASRKGDVPILVADSKKFSQDFNWYPQYSDLHTILTTAYNWHFKNRETI